MIIRPKITLIIWAKDRFFSNMLRDYLHTQDPEINVIGTANDYTSCLALLAKRDGSTDIVIIRITACDDQEIADINSLKHDSPRSDVIIIADTVPRERVYDILDIRAAGYVGGQEQNFTILQKTHEAILVVARKEDYYDDDFIPPNVLAKSLKPPVRPKSLLTHQEKLVLKTFLDHPDWTNTQLAKALYLSKHTVDQYMKNIREKSQSRNKAEILSKAASLLG